MDPGACMVCGAPGARAFCTASDRVLPRKGERWSIVRCPSCGFGWTFPPLPPEDIPSYYPASYVGDAARAADEYLSGRLSGTRTWRGETGKARLVEEFVRGGSILDVGTGDGKFLWALDPARWERTGVEVARKTVEAVRARMPQLRLVCGDIYAAELYPGEYDAVTFWHTLEHIPEPRRVLARAAALLRPGGWLFASLPNLDSLQARLFREHWYAFGDVPRHLYHFSPRSLDRLLGEVGLAVRARRLFSPQVNLHCLKHSLLHWSETRFSSRLPYYLLKPALMAFPLLERLSASYGILTVIARAG